MPGADAGAMEASSRTRASSEDVGSESGATPADVGMPLVWSSNWRTVIASDAEASPSANSGRYRRTGASRSTAPRSASWLTARAVIPLDTDPRRNGVSASTGRPAASAVPNPEACTRLLRTTTTAAPGMPASRRSASNQASMAASAAGPPATGVAGARMRTLAATTRGPPTMIRRRRRLERMGVRGSLGWDAAAKAAMRLGWASSDLSSVGSTTPPAIPRAADPVLRPTTGPSLTRRVHSARWTSTSSVRPPRPRSGRRSTGCSIP